MRDHCGGWRCPRGIIVEGEGVEFIVEVGM